MKNKSCVSTWIISRIMMAASVVALAACAGQKNDDYAPIDTPTVDYVEQLDVYSAPHQDSFLNQLAMNYRSYAIYNARTSGYSEMGELFAQKAVAAFSGEVPFPETLDNWPVADQQTAFELSAAYNDLIEQFKNDATTTNPQLAAEAQAKFDCWLSAAASGQDGTARECRDRFQRTLTALRDCQGGKIVNTKQQNSAIATTTASETVAVKSRITNASNVPTDYYPDTRSLRAVNGAGRAREGVIIVNNVNVPQHLINPVPVQPVVFNQNIYGGDKSMSNSNNTAVLAADCGNNVNNADCVPQQQTTEEIPQIGDELVSRQEFINMMMAMRAELAAINSRLDQIQAATNEKTIIKVQQIPLEPKQHVMEEVFEIRFDFNKATIKPEYQDLIRKLADATQNNKNIKVSVVGHTDTMGSKDYNYALGGRRAEAVQKMLIKYGIPASQIVAVSSGEEDLAVPTADGVANAANRRVRVVKETHYTEEAKAAPIVVEEYSATEPCGMYGCDE